MNDIIPINKFMLFKQKCNKEILLFNKVINSPKVDLKKLNLKNENLLALILNKITLNNYQDKAKEYLSNMFLGSNESLDNLTRQIYFKMISDEYFQYCYLKFYQFIISAYNHYGIKYDYSYLVNLVETKYLMDIYQKDTLLGKIINKEITDEKKFCYHNIRIIIILIKEKILSDNLYQHILKDFINKIDYAEELLVILKCYQEKQEEIISQLDLSKYNMRYKVIFEEMLVTETVCDESPIIIKSKNDNKETLFRNIINEYLFIEEIDEIIIFVEKNLTSNLDKNKFVEIIIEIYLDNENQILLDLLIELYNKNFIKKHNIFEGTTTSIEKNKCGKLKDVIKVFYQKHNIKL